jgi:2-iminobutanoate/2-iminopropanoate deaminase
MVDGRERLEEGNVERASTGNAPAAIGPYSQAIDAGGMLFCSGQVGIEPATRKLADGIEAQTEQALRNLDAVLQAAGSSMADIVETTLWLTDPAISLRLPLYTPRHFPEPATARSAPIDVAIPLAGALISIEAITVRSAGRPQ